MNRMKLYIGLFALAAIITAPIVSFAHTPAIVNNKPAASLAPMLTKVTPAVVNITVAKTTPKQPFQPPALQAKKKHTAQIAVGSGVIINAKTGLIVTNAHVIQNAHIILVTLKDGRRYRAKLVGKSIGFDIAIIKIHAKNLMAIPFGDSDKLKVGDFVAAIGSPFGFTQTVTSGVISALNRSRPKIEGFQSFIQTDAPINPGNSGGALVNMKGQLIGINTALFTPIDANIGIGFSIPSNMVHSVIQQLLKYGKVSRGILGVIAQNITPVLANAMGIQKKQGAIVTQVVPGSPAQKAKIQPRDIIIGLNHKTIKSAVQLRNDLGMLRPGTKIVLVVIRNHKQLQIHATVGNPKAMLKQHAIPFLSGLRLQKFKELEGNGKQLTGALVTGVSNMSQGALAGLQPGDIITHANFKKINSVKSLENIADHSQKPLLLKVMRGKGSLFLVIEPQQQQKQS